MRCKRRQSGMSLMELLVALAVILILIGTLIGVGSHVKTRANLDLTRAMLETLSTALAKYHSDFGDFPFDTDVDGDGDLDVLDIYLQSHLEADLGGTVSPVNSLQEKDGNGDWISTASSAALFYFLDKNPSSQTIAAAVPNSLITNKDDSGAAIQFTFTAPPNNMIDLPRYIDPWKISIRYEYLTGTAFPVLTSAGPDKVFDTPDDITSK
ncbi:MAG: hypothetical protein DRP56_06125 [Planctomycetota bacterium]|nr:MAG: hypothetical protein DRP56_06125 [Planctomycetota bacterium]